MALIESIRGNYQQLNSQIKELESLNVKSADYFKILTGGNLTQVLENKPLEVFIPYEPKKKAEEVIIV